MKYDIAYLYWQSVYFEQEQIQVYFLAEMPGNNITIFNERGLMMKSSQSTWLVLVIATVFSLLSLTARASGELMPFVLGSNIGGDMASKIADTKKALKDNGFAIAGEYSPYENAHIIVVTNQALKKAAASHSRAGYLAAQRVSITKVGDKIQVAYTNPDYMAAAYRVEVNMSKVAAALKAALGYIKGFGPEKGLSKEELNDYQYTFGMEYFDDPNELASYPTKKKALAVVNKNLKAHLGGVFEVYRIDIPNTKQTLIGVGMKKVSEKGNKYMDDKYVMSEIDFKETRSTAHLPYEILVNGGKIEGLHSRFRIAMNFPDLSMMGDNSFMNIMASPNAIRDAMIGIAGGEIPDDI